MISGRMLCRENIFMFIDETSETSALFLCIFLFSCDAYWNGWRVVVTYVEKYLSCIRVYLSRTLSGVCWLDMSHVWFKRQHYDPWISEGEKRTGERSKPLFFKHLRLTDSDLSFIGVLAILSAILGRLRSPETIDDSECESAIEAIGQIGSCKYPFTFVWLATKIIIKKNMSQQVRIYVVSTFLWHQKHDSCYSDDFACVQFVRRLFETDWSIIHYLTCFVVCSKWPSFSFELCNL